MIWVLCCKRSATGAFTTARINNEWHGVLLVAVKKILKYVMASSRYGFFIGVFQVLAIERHARHLITWGMVAMDVIRGINRAGSHFNGVITRF